jgi:hypothetical protein
MKDRPKAFARGFVSFSTSSSFGEFLSASSIPPYLDCWLTKRVGPVTVIHDSCLMAEQVGNDACSVLVMGICVNPFDGSATVSQVAALLHDALLRGQPAFYDYLDQISGNFTVIFNRGSDVRILQDCAGTKPVYYLEHPDVGVVASSHARLLAETLGLQEDPRAALVYQSQAYRADPSRYLPGDVTPFENLDPLTANNELLFNTGKTRRFFPRGPLEEYTGTFDELAHRIADIFKAQARLLASSGRPLILATTGGKDSRTSLSAFSDCDNVELFSFHFSANGALSKDVATAVALSERTNRKLSIYDLSKISDADFSRFFEFAHPRGVWPAVALCYFRNFDANAIHIRSTVSEIGRLFYGAAPSKISASHLSRVYTGTSFGVEEMVVSSMASFMRLSNFEMDQFHNFNAHDMFYWEHRNAKWQNLLCQEAEIATDVFIPFNNRRLIQLFLLVPENMRKAAELHRAITGIMCPEVRDIPYI